MKKAIVTATVTIAILSLSIVIIAFVGVGCQKSNNITYTVSGIFTKTDSYHIDYKKLGEEQKIIREKNDQTTIAKINGTEIAMKDFMLNKLSSDLQTAKLDTEFINTDQIFSKMIRLTVIFQDCQDKGIIATDEEALQKYDENYQALVEASKLPVTEPDVEYTNPDGPKVVVSSSQQLNAAKVALEEFEQKLEGLGLSHAEYRNSIGKETFKKSLLMQRHIEKIVTENRWSEGEALDKYEQYVQQMVTEAHILKTENFPF